MGNQGKPVVGIPRWLTTANLLGIVLAFTLAIPFGARASHHPAPSGLDVFGRPTVSGGSWAPTAAKLKWTDSALGVTEYALQRSTSSTFNANVVEWRIAKNTFEFWDETFTRVGTFYYRIWSYVGADRSTQPSNTETLVNNSAAALPAAAPSVPTELTAVPEGSGVRFSWKDNSANETFFRVERAQDGGQTPLTWLWRGNVALASGAGSRVSFLDTDPGAEPTYRVTVFNGKGLNRSYAFGPVHAVPGVDTQGVMSMVNNIGSNVPTNLQSLVPTNLTSVLPSDAVGTVNGIVSPFASSASGLLSAVPAPSGVQSSLNTLASGLASATGPLVSPWTGLASGLASTAGSVIANPTGLLPNTNNYGLWFSLRIAGTPPTYFFPVWILPASCAGSGVCPPPATPTCNPIVAPFEYCFYIDTVATS